MNKPSSRYLSYQCSLFKGVTFHEFLVIVSCGTGGSLLLGITVGVFLRHVALIALLSLMIGGILSIFWLPRQFAKRKKGKPHGYLVKSVRLQLARFNLIENPYTFYQGAWQKAKHFKE